ncbi:uncharacterized protein RAG0_01211 [Rhynchosporium agropyri]|uniref:TeaA receptor TeaR n=1 Tax=Rhynchosporium agropyri TaxID=914238 RepID=A0A1E1JWH3_9HELO|nr:uncharacterized protein RAG0_01211 [Rhynchosporium agropyri]
MAAVSAPQASSSLTPPSSSYGGQNLWNYAVPSQSEISQKSAEHSRPPQSHTNGHALGHQTSRTDLTQRRPDYTSTRSTDSGYLAPARINALNRKDSSTSETGSAPDSLLDLHGEKRSGINNNDYGDRKQAIAVEEDDSERSRWIHRDKLARIESQELQAAGIIFPQARTLSKSGRREHSRDQQGNVARSEQEQSRQRVEPVPTEEEESSESNVWDLRLPEEAASEEHMEGYQDISGGVKGVSRIPVLKTSPLPIPMLHLERDTPIRRSGLVEEDSIAYPKSRGRSQSFKALEEITDTPTPARRLVSESSPTKKTPLRKGSVSANRAASAGQRPKTRSGSNQLNAGQRPTTRSGELGPSNSTNKRPEGDPPWLATMFKPDPRLPPDQQLLPTVAKRLQQEQWEKEGKFGTTYDTDFRPLNDEVLRAPSPAAAPPVIEAEKKPEQPLDPEWPLRDPKSPALSTGRPGTAGNGSYSTMPKIHTGVPMGVGPLPSPKLPVRTQEPPEDSKKGGCVCCAVM